MRHSIVGFRRPVLLLAVAAGGLLALAGGIAYATIPDSSGVIHSCRNNGSGLLRVIDSANSACTPAEQPLDWVQARAYEVFHVSDVEVTGTSRATGTQIMTLHLGPGAYAVTTEVVVRGTGDWLIKCSSLAANDSRGPQEGFVRGAIGTAPGDSRLTSLAGIFGADIPNGDDVRLSCWKQGAGSGDNPIVETADMTAVRVQSVTSGGG